MTPAIVLADIADACGVRADHLIDFCWYGEALIVTTSEGPFVLEDAGDGTWKAEKLSAESACNFVPNQSKNAAQSTPKSYTFELNTQQIYSVPSGPWEKLWRK